jgi:hypothetical protein
MEWRAGGNQNLESGYSLSTPIRGEIMMGKRAVGEPTSLKKESWFTEVWFYDFGSGSFVYYVKFVGDVIERIQTGGYGS